MGAGNRMLGAILLLGSLVYGCGGGGSSSPTTPTLTFATISAQTYGAASFAVSASSTSSGAITYSVTSGPATISGATVTLTGIGTVTLSASQAAGGNYTAATASTSFTVNAETPTVAFAAIPTQIYGNAPFTVSASSASSGAITYSITSGPATISGATVTLTGVGTVDLEASQAASGNFAAATATVSFIVTSPTPTADTPTITTSSSNGAQNGAVIVSLATITTAGSPTIYYTLDGSTPTTSSQPYEAPILVGSNLTVKAITAASGYNNSTVATQTFTPNIASGTLIWSDEFSNSGGTPAQPNAATWTYDLGTDCCGNNELETYCAWNSSVGPCNPSNPNSYLGTDGYLHIVAEQPTAGTATYTSARLKTQGLFSFQYGRIEARLMLPESQGMWPAFWLLGNNITTESWPACGEADVMEHIDGNNTPFGGAGTGAAPGYDWAQSSVHGTGLNAGQPYTTAGFSAAAWHTYGMIWSKGKIQYYIDSPTGSGQPYETFTPTTQAGTWPFDQGPQFIILNLAVGGSWPGNPDTTTVFPSQMVVDYVRIYAN